jgi:exopolyphosphatase/guanosine-5'-triphosphate,3'-diphosphate pyrophosphatase
MRVGIVDLGGNTAGLLVAQFGPQGLERVLTNRVVLGLGSEIERTGRIPKSKLAATEAAVASLCSRARKTGCVRVEVLVTSPGRRSANRKALERSLRRGGGRQIRFVTGAEEAQLAYAGAVAFAPTGAEAVAVCDVGGGSTEIAIGSASALPSWCTSLDLGSLSVTRRCFRTLPPGKGAIEAARADVRSALAALAPYPPAASEALASGGTARALRKLVGAALGRDELDEALGILRCTSPRKLAARFELPVWRAEVLAGGALVLSEIQALLGVPLTVAEGGLREGAALQLLEHVSAAAA